MKLKATSLAATFLVGLIPAVCHAQDFSAEVVYLTTSKPNAPSTGTRIAPHPASDIFVSKDKMRLETRGLTDTILLVNRTEHSTLVLFPAKKAYQPLANGPSQYFWVENADDACPDWQKAADQKIDCEKVGPEVVGGRPAVKYQNKGASDATTAAIWVDSALKFVVKWEGASAGAELRNIKEAQQPADLFSIPSAYTLLHPQKVTSKGFAQKSR